MPRTDLLPEEWTGYCGGRTEKLGKEKEGNRIISPFTAVTFTGLSQMCVKPEFKSSQNCGK